MKCKLKLAFSFLEKCDGNPSHFNVSGNRNDHIPQKMSLLNFSLIVVCIYFHRSEWPKIVNRFKMF